MFKGRRFWLSAGFAALFLVLLGVFVGPIARAAIPLPAAWLAEQEPFRIADNLYYVGSKDLGCYLVVTPAGLIVLDGGLEENGPQVLANIRKLGFDPKRIKILINSHAHTDHAGGLAAIKAASGAKLYASARDKPFLESGGKDDPALGNLALFPPVKVDHVLADGEKVTLGGVTLTAHLTPGHTPGCTTWSLPVNADGKVRNALFICSVTVLPTVKLAGPKPAWPGIAEDFSRTFATLRAQPCDIFLGSHGGFYDMLAKRERQLKVPKGPNPFIDPAGCKAYLDQGQAIFDRRLAADR